MSGERKPNIKHYFVLPHLSVPLQICNGTDTNGIILAHMQHLMGVVFCVWCGICVKYLAFGTYPTSTVGALNTYLFVFLDMLRCHHILYSIYGHEVFMSVFLDIMINMPH